MRFDARQKRILTPTPHTSSLKASDHELFKEFKQKLNCHYDEVLNSKSSDLLQKIKNVELNWDICKRNVELLSIEKRTLSLKLELKREQVSCLRKKIAAFKSGAISDSSTSINSEFVQSQSEIFQTVTGQSLEFSS